MTLGQIIFHSSPLFVGSCCPLDTKCTLFRFFVFVSHFRPYFIDRQSIDEEMKAIGYFNHLSHFLSIMYIGKPNKGIRSSSSIVLSLIENNDSRDN